MKSRDRRGDEYVLDVNVTITRPLVPGSPDVVLYNLQTLLDRHSKFLDLLQSSTQFANVSGGQVLSLDVQTEASCVDCESSPNHSLIIGVAAAIVVVVALLTVLIVLVMRRRNRRAVFAASNHSGWFIAEFGSFAIIKRATREKKQRSEEIEKRGRDSRDSDRFVPCLQAMRRRCTKTCPCRPIRSIMTATNRTFFNNSATARLWPPITRSDAHA